MPGRRRILDHVAGDRRVGFHIDADAGAIIRIGAARTLGKQVADQVALHHGEPAALVEIGYRDADRGPVDGVIGDQGTLETEFRIERHLAHVADGIALDLEVGGGVAAHG